MVFKRLDIRIVVIALISSVLGSIFILSLVRIYLRVTSAGILVLWIISIAYLIYWLHKMRREMEQFLDTMESNDLNHSFKERKTDGFIRSLHKRFNELSSSFRLVRIEKEREQQFFRHTIENIGTGLLAFDDNGNIRASNKALNTMLGTGPENNISHYEKVSSQLPELLEKIRPGDQFLLKIMASDRQKYISVFSTEFKMDQDIISLATFQDISREIDKTESEAWQKLMKVVIHEITGSVVPFRLLSSKLLAYLKPSGIIPNQLTLNKDTLNDAVSVLETMHKRSTGLSRFADSYKALDQVTRPKLQDINILNLFTEVKLNFSEILNKSSITLEITIEPVYLEFRADEQLVFQVLLNLVRNAILAVTGSDDPQIALRAYVDGDHIILEVRDNGKGIPEDIMDSIFIPFFTTREDGSGIGLSLAKQVMNAHNGSIVPFSEPGKGTVFRLIF